MASAPNPLQPTWQGHISSTMDALLLFEACLEGRFAHVPRRPHDREREELIRSGNVFIYEEHSSGIKRWTDGYNWSPSRILGNFLIYRELEKAFPPGEKKKAIKKKNKNGGISKPEPPRPTPTTNIGAAAASAMNVNSSEAQNDTQRALIGSLVDSYPFKEEGLVKKTISVHWNGIPHHLVSYYKVADVTSGILQTPGRDPRLRGIIPRGGLISSQNFRVPVDQDDFYGEDRWPFYNQPHGFDPNVNMLPYRSLSMPNVNAGMVYQNNYSLPPQPLHQLQTLPSNVANGHFSSHVQPTGYTSYDPIRHSQQSRHSISAAGSLANDYSKLNIDGHRRASISNYDASLVTTSPDISGLPATTITSAEPRSNFYSSNILTTGYSDFDYINSPSSWPTAETLHTGR